MTIKQLDKKDILVPEVEVRISESWISFITWCKNNIPNGQVCVKVNNGEPSVLVQESTKLLIRFDKKSMQTPYQPFMQS